MSDVTLFQAHRPLLFAIAYRMLGSASEADDVVQDAYLRYAAAPKATLESPKAYLSTIVTRLCLDRLKAAHTTREAYIGSWLPEPVLTPEAAPDPEHRAERHEPITLAFLVLLEALAPQERAVFLMREVFEYEYAEIAPMLGLTTANCRQLFHRAKERIAAGRPRFKAAPERQYQLVERFLAATQRGDIAGLASLLAADVTYTADGGGKVSAVRQPVAGRDTVLKILLGLARNAANALHVAPAEVQITRSTVNAEPAVLIWAGARLDTIFVFTCGENQIDTVRAIRNPDKLAFIRRQLQAGADEPATDGAKQAAE